jgi:ABC-type lipoprotein export system ATPase subunit
MGVDLARPSLGPVKVTHEDELAKTANRLIRMKDGEIMS